MVFSKYFLIYAFMMNLYYKNALIIKINLAPPRNVKLLVFPLNVFKCNTPPNCYKINTTIHNIKKNA